MVFVTDLAFLAGLGYSAYRTLGRWIQFTDETAKRLSGERQCGSRRTAFRTWYMWAASMVYYCVASASIEVAQGNSQRQI